jgi:hypothetical protein
VRGRGNHAADHREQRLDDHRGQAHAQVVEYFDAKIAAQFLGYLQPAVRSDLRSWCSGLRLRQSIIFWRYIVM